MGIQSISVLDGRYRHYMDGLNDIFSEYGLMKYRVFVEIQWLKFLIFELKVEEVDAGLVDYLDNIFATFTPERALEIKAIEKRTNHDVKAVEYYIKQQLIDGGFDSIKEWVHFACTSDDINNTAYALMLQAGRSHIVESLSRVLDRLEVFARENKSAPMMARTHGQPATPTTVGKEFVNFAWRLRTEMAKLEAVEIGAKLNGASGNFNAHHCVLPEIDWIAASRRFLTHYLGVAPLLYTTQINPCNYISELLQAMIRIAAIHIDLDRDMWGYISLGYFKQKLKEGEVGSSTMPHKVNPIDFENSEGNMGLAISMMEHVSVKLLISRFQRDLSDSTVLRNLGVLFGYVEVGLKSTLKGLDKLAIDRIAIEKDLADNLELLAEPIQTAMRMYKEDEPYEKLKALTRGRKIDRGDLVDFLDRLEALPDSVKNRFKQLEVTAYTGLAEELVDQYFSEMK